MGNKGKNCWDEKHYTSYTFLKYFAVKSHKKCTHVWENYTFFVKSWRVRICKIFSEKDSLKT